MTDIKQENVTVIIPIKSSDFYLIPNLLPRLKKFIASSNIVIISSADIAEDCNKHHVKFLDENAVFEGLSFTAVKQKLQELGMNEKACGWFLQQFIKLAFCYKCKTEYYLSWDADMLPLRKINLFNEEGKPYLTLKKEYHERYFTTLKKLLNLDKIRNESYIAEHMLFHKKLVQEMISEINRANLNGTQFWEKILSATLPESLKDSWAFSEFETYGTWVDSRYPQHYAKRKLNMFRHGKYYFGDNCSEDTLEWVAKSFDTISFEHFDTQSNLQKYVKFFKKYIPVSLFLKVHFLLLKNKQKKVLKEFDWFWGNETTYKALKKKKKR